MSEGARRALVAIVALACGVAGCEDEPAPPPRAARGPHQRIFAPTSDPGDVDAPGAERPIRDSPIAIQLARGRLVALEPSRARPRRPGSFDGVLVLREGETTATASDPRVRVTASMIATPRAPRRALAYYRLAHALDVDIVPARVERHLPAADLVALLAPHPGAGDALRAQAVVQNDGTVPVTLSALSIDRAGSPWTAPVGRELSLPSAPEPATWAAWGASRTPAAGEDTGVLRAYLSMLVLDYLSGNVLRRTAWLCPEAHTLVLTDNQTAFQPTPDAEVQARVLRQIRGFLRFPRPLRDRLLRFDKIAIEERLQSGAFEDWLIAPRVVVEISERRAALVSLIDARIREHGEEAVLSL